MKFKVGDRVRVKSLDWYEKSEKDLVGSIRPDVSKIGFSSEMTESCGKVLIIKRIRPDKDRGNHYHTKDEFGEDVLWNWCDWMLEDEIVDEVSEKSPQSKIEDIANLVGDMIFPIKIDLKNKDYFYNKGLSKREYIATQLLSGLLSSENSKTNVVETAVLMTDQLIEELKRKVKVEPLDIPGRKNPTFQSKG